MGRIVFAAAMSHVLDPDYYGTHCGPRGRQMVQELMGLVGENVAIICASLARAAGVKTIVYCGSTLDANRALEQVLSMATRLFGAEPVYLAQGAYCGAFGAAALAR